MPIRSFQQLQYEATWLGPKRLAIAAAANGEILEAAREAQTAGMAQCILIEDRQRLCQVAERQGIDLQGMTLVDATDPNEAAFLAMAMARSGDADIVMKGTLKTASFMRAALDPERGLRAGHLFTHVAVFEVPGFDRLLLISDGGIVVAPDIYQKVEIVQHSIDVAHKLGIPMPKVAVLAAAELVDPKIPATVDAANLAKMAQRDQIKGGIVDGPLALDNAISPGSTLIKGIDSPVTGDADILIVPDVEAGNLLAKAITYFGHGEMAGIVVGGCVPIVLTSRADSHVTKLVSMALGVLMASSGYQSASVRVDDLL